MEIEKTSANNEETNKETAIQYNQMGADQLQMDAAQEVIMFFQLQDIYFESARIKTIENLQGFQSLLVTNVLKTKAIDFKKEFNHKN